MFHSCPCPYPTIFPPNFNSSHREHDFFTKLFTVCSVYYDVYITEAAMKEVMQYDSQFIFFHISYRIFSISPKSVSIQNCQDAPPPYRPHPR